MFRAQQKRVVTWGRMPSIIWQAFSHAGNGRVLYVSGIKEKLIIFIAMLEKLRHHYRRAKTITLILDNPIIHKKQTDRAMVEEESQVLPGVPASLQPWLIT